MKKCLMVLVCLVCCFCFNSGETYGLESPEGVFKTGGEKYIKAKIPSDAITSKLLIKMRFKPYDFSEARYLLGIGGEGGVRLCLSLSPGGEGILFGISSTKTGWPEELICWKQMNAGEFYELVAAFDGSEMRVYLNGENICSKNLGYSGAITGKGEDLFVGRRPWALEEAGGRFDGEIDYVQVFNKINSGTESLTPSAPDDSIILFYKMDEKEGKTIKDYSGNGRDGQVIEEEINTDKKEGKTLLPLPKGFAERVERGWLPAMNVKPSTSEAPRSEMRIWAQPYARGKVKALFLCSSKTQYEVVDICRNFDIDANIIPAWVSAVRGVPFDEDNLNLLRYYLDRGPPEVIVASGVHAGILPPDIQDRVVELVNSGMGFIWALPGINLNVPGMQGEDSSVIESIFPMHGPKEKYGQFSCAVKPKERHPLTAGVAFDLMRWCSDADTSVKPGAVTLLEAEVPGRCMAACWEQGKGRVLVYNRIYQDFTYDYPLIPMPYPVDQKGTSETNYGKFSRWLTPDYAYAVPFYCWLGKAIHWAARREPEVILESLEVTDLPLALKMRIKDTTATTRPLQVKGIVRSALGSREEVFSKIWKTMPGTSQAIIVPLPDTRLLGQHLVECIVLNDKEAVENFASLSINRTGLFTAELPADYTIYEPISKVKVPVAVSNHSDGARNATIHLRLFDTDGRLLVEKESALMVASGETSTLEGMLDLASCPPTTRLVNLQAVVTLDRESIELRDQLFVRQPEQWDDVHFVGYGDITWYWAPFDNIYHQQLKLMGFDTLLRGYFTASRLRLLTETGMRFVPNNVIALGAANAVKMCDPFSPVAYELQDEPELLGAPSPESGWDDPKSLEIFATWLQKKYGSLEASNEAWNTGYEGWEEVRRWRWWDVAKQANWTPWFDSRHHLDALLPDRFGSDKETIDKTATTGKYYWVNPRSMTPFSGFDVYAMTKRLGSASLYTEYCSSGNSGGNVGFLELGHDWVSTDGVLQSVIGYTWPSSPGEDRIKHEAWFALTRGVRHLAWFVPVHDESPPETRFSFLNGDFSPNAKGKIIADINAKILSGPGKIIANSTPVKDDVLLVHSRPSYYAKVLGYMQALREKDPERDPATINGPNVWENHGENSFVVHLRALGYQYEFVEENDLTVEKLKLAKVMCLSRNYCMSEKHLELLNSFAQNGGVVLAEAGTAIRNDQGSLNERTPDAFRNLFGLERTIPISALEVRPEEISPLDAEKIAAPGVSGDIYKKGQTFYFNFQIPSDFNTCILIENLLTNAGVKPSFALKNNYIEPGTNLPIAQLAAFRRGNLAYLVLLGEGNRRDDGFMIQLPEFQEVYDILDDKSLGRLDRIEGRINWGRVKMFALSPARVSEMSVQPDREKYLPGDSVKIDLHVSTQHGNAGDRVIALNISHSPGDIMPVIPKFVVLKNGQSRLTIHLPFNVKNGIMKIEARDLTSGMITDTQFEIK